MDTGKWEARIAVVGYRRTMDVWIFQNHRDSTEVVQAPDLCTTVPVGEVLPDPTLRLLPEQLQALAEALNQAGYHPRKEFLEGKLEATDKHLQDMRQMLKLK